LSDETRYRSHAPGARKMYLCARLVWEKRSIPLYWRLLDKKGSSEYLRTTCTAITPVLELLSDYKIIIVSPDRCSDLQWPNRNP